MLASSARLAPGAEVRLLLRRELVDLDAERRELEERDLAVDAVGHRMDARLERGAAADEVLDDKGLKREGHVHDGRRVALARGEVHHASRREQVQAPVAEVVLL